MRLSITREVKAPVRAHSEDAGIDFFVPKFDEQFLADLQKKNESEILAGNIEITSDYIVLKPQGRLLVPSGVHVDLETLANNVVDLEGAGPDDLRAGVALVVHNKSGVGSKKGLDRLAEVIDQPYQGEVHLNIVNTGTESQTIKADDKLVQMLIIPVIYSKPTVVPFEELYKGESERGDKGFGHTDNK